MGSKVRLICNSKLAIDVNMSTNGCGLCLALQQTCDMSSCSMRAGIGTSYPNEQKRMDGWNIKHSLFLGPGDNG